MPSIRVRGSFRPWGARCTLHLATLTLLFSCPASASDVQENAGRVGISERQAELARQILAEEDDLRPLTVGLMRFRASYPQKVSAGFGWMHAQLPASEDCKTVCKLKGPTFQIEPGFAGVQLGAGYAHLIGEKRTSKRLLEAVYVGFGGKAVLLRTYGDSPLTPRDQTLIGAEGDLTVASANLSLGVLRSLSDDRGRGWILTVGLGWGY